jgi:hypothetical protein
MILRLQLNYLDHEMEVRTHIRIMKQSALTNEARGLQSSEMLIW